jgi:hypothetical protein
MLAIVLNGLVMLAEIAAVVGIAALGYHYPASFAAATAGLALAIGLALERARLQNEMPFYFEGEGRWRALSVWVVAIAEATIKALLAGVAALITFSGTDRGRLFWVALVFGVAVYAGSAIARRLSISFGARPLRWGWFRLAVPLGLMVSFALSFLPAPSFTDLGRRLIFDLPDRPTLAQASETLFVLKQKFDALVASLLTWLVPAEWAQILGALVSVNVLTGFVAAIYAVLIAEGVRRAGG